MISKKVVANFNKWADKFNKIDSEMDHAKTLLWNINQRMLGPIDDLEMARMKRLRSVIMKHIEVLNNG